LRLARLRRRRLRRLWLLRVLGTLPHLLKGTLHSNPERNKPQPALRDWPRLNCASSARRTRVSQYSSQYPSASQVSGRQVSGSLSWRPLSSC
jgi:hypothetical protein